MLKRPRAATFMTHVAALGIGAAIWAGWRQGHPAAKLTDTERPEAKRSARRSSPSVAGSELLTEALQAAKVGDGAPENPDFVAKGLALARSTRLPAQPGVALNAALKKWEAEELKDDGEGAPEVFALIYQWMAADSAAFVQFLFSDREMEALHQKMMDRIYPQAALGMIADKGPLALLPAMTAPPNAYNQPYNLPQTLGQGLAKRLDMAEISAVKAKLRPDLWPQVARALARNWPPGRGQELFQFALQENNPSLLNASYSRRDGLGAAALAAMSDESIPEAFRDQLKNDGIAQNLINLDLTLPLETRLQYGYMPNREEESKRICKQDVEAVMTNGPVDWSHLYKVGAATADEILAAVSAGSPDLAANNPDGVRMEVFQHLAEQNPEKSMELLKDLPEDQRTSAVLMAGRTYFNDVDPAIFLKLLQQVPANTPELFEQRLDTWNARSATNLTRLDEAYARWVEGLPPGLDREMALFSAARAAESTDQGLAARLRGQVTDPKLLQKMSATR